ncbi:MAG: hypothetical protein AAGH15_20515 [Myxococcota bacterium]
MSVPPQLDTSDPPVPSASGGAEGSPGGEGWRAALEAAGLPMLAEGERAGLEGPEGVAASVDPEGGDTEAIVVTAAGADRPWRIDRRSGRAEALGGGLRRDEAEDAADLADRAQLVLGHPVTLSWAFRDGRPVVRSLEALVPQPRFVEGRWRLLTLVAPDEGTVVPLGVDTLDRALGARSTRPAVDVTVRRIFARPYRRREDEGASLGRGRAEPLPRAVRRAARAGKDVAPFLGDAIRYERGAPVQLRQRGLVDLSGLGDEPLLAEARERQRLVADALLLLDDGRRASREALLALEAVIGALDDGMVEALAAPRSPRERRRIGERLEELREREAREGRALAGEQTTLRGELGDVRPLGIDLEPGPIGASDASLERALATNRGGVYRERARLDAEREAALRARRRGLGRVAPAQALTALLRRVARAKGGVSHAHAIASLAFRDTALAVGRRLVAAAVLDRAIDALYLEMEELARALRGEPGAYAARVRLRREDDQRWARFEPPRTLGDPI